MSGACVTPLSENTGEGRSIPTAAATGFFVLPCLLTAGGSEGRIDRGSHCTALTPATQSCV